MKQKFVDFFTKNKRTLIIIGVVLGVVVIVIGWTAMRGQSALRAQMDELQTVEIEAGSLVATVGATGTVRAHQTANLVWQVAGTVDEVMVELGDRVAEGEVLATLEQTSLPQNVILAQAELVSAEQALEDLYESHEDLALAQAQKVLADARDAERDAGLNLTWLKYPASKREIEASYARLVIAEKKLDRAKTVYNFFKKKPENNIKRANATANLDSAQDAYDAALRNYNSASGSAHEVHIAQGEADLLVAQQNVIEAQEEYDRLLKGPDADDIAAAEARVAAAQATMKLSWIEAPFSGTVTMAEPMPGDTVATSSSGFRMDDFSRLLVDVEISEVDINRVEVGQDVLLTFDAILAQEYHGKVVEVSPVGVPQQGIVNFDVTVELEDHDYQVKPGMTAAVNIVVTQLENVLIVPNRAVRVVDGMRVVYILSGGQLDMVEIQLGDSSDLYSEVADGDLKDGDVVVLNPPLNFFQMSEGGPPPGMGGGMGGPP
jgi:HlyD family secretion protein